MLDRNDSGITAVVARRTVGGEHVGSWVSSVQGSEPFDVGERVGISAELTRELENDTDLSGTKT